MNDILKILRAVDEVLRIVPGRARVDALNLRAASRLNHGVAARHLLAENIVDDTSRCERLKRGIITGSGHHGAGVETHGEPAQGAIGGGG